MPESDVSPKRPSDVDSYLRWLTRAHQLDVGPSLKTRYETIVAKLKSDFLGSSFWQKIVAELNEIDSAYRLQANYPLLLSVERPEVVTKPYRSFLLKTFRRNVVENESWPDPPSGGWYLPDRSYDRFNDLVRTSFVVKYLDGVAFLGTRLAKLCAGNGVEHDLSFEARMEGHYAAHLCTTHEFEVPGRKWDTEAITATVEFQITTQLQEVIQKLLHRYYEARRVLPEREKSNWQWEYESEEFSANYLGHILHYVEGMIMDVRARQERAGGSIR